MAIPGDFDTVAESKLYVSAALPASFDAAGYAALTWTEVGQITNVGSVRGREYSTSTLTVVSNPQEREKKGSYKLPNAEFECAWVEDDEGQLIIQAGANSYDTYSFRLDKQNDDKRYFAAQISKFVENNGQSNDAVKGMITLLRQTDTISVAA